MSDSVRLMHYDPRWRQEFEQTRSSILHSCLGWVGDVQHIGSTAIAGLVAQPIVDVIAGVSEGADSRQAIEESVNLIEGLNYRVGDLGSWVSASPRNPCRLLMKPRHGEVTHRVLVTIVGSSVWRRCLSIRDALRDDRELALRFEEMKVARWKQGEGDAEKYAQDKSVFFTHLLDQVADA